MDRRRELRSLAFPFIFFWMARGRVGGECLPAATEKGRSMRLGRLSTCRTPRAAKGTEASPVEVQNDRLTVASDFTVPGHHRVGATMGQTHLN